MLSPIDLETKEFKKSAFGGYDKEEVDQFMDLIFQDYKTLYMDNVSLKDKVNTLSSAVTKYKSMEDILQNTLIVAQTPSDELKKSANDRARLIVEEAEHEAQKAVFDAQQKVSEAQLQLNNAQMQVSNYKRQILIALQGIQEMVESIPGETERTDTNGLRQDAEPAEN